MLRCKTFVCNPYQQCTYVVNKEGEKNCFIVDAGMYTPDEQQAVSEYIRREQLVVEAILVTHSHPDHICGLEWLQKTYPDAKLVQYTAGSPAPMTIRLSSSACQILRTPGHKEDCLCYYLPDEGVLFSGDTLFYGSVGRTDLPGGDYMTLIESLHRLIQLPAETKVYPGHGEPTTIAHEKQYNPFV